MCIFFFRALCIASLINFHVCTAYNTVIRFCSTYIFEGTRLLRRLGWVRRRCRDSALAHLTLYTASHSNKSSLAPLFTPGVFHLPEVLVVLWMRVVGVQAVADNENAVVDVTTAIFGVINATFVQLERFCIRLDGNGYRLLRNSLFKLLLVSRRNILEAVDVRHVQTKLEAVALLNLG